MTDPMHLIIPYAATAAPACRAALQGLRLPHLERLLARLTVTDTDTDPADTLAPALPHERALARALGRDDTPGTTPWAALALQAAGEEPGEAAWAWLVPCHWQVGMDNVVLQDPAGLQLTPAESRALTDAMAPYCREDGIVLGPDPSDPGRWLARGEVFRQQTCVTLDRVIGQPVKPWLQRAGASRTLQRLQSEMQMLLYTHAVNDDRAARGLPTVNAFWVTGAGALAPGSAAPAHPPSVALGLRESALRDDGSAWATAWQRLDGTACADLLARLDEGAPVTLTLCSERSARTLQARPRPLWQRISSHFSLKPASAGLSML